MPFYIVWGKPLRLRDVSYLLERGFMKLHKGLWISRSNSIESDLKPILDYYFESITILKTSRKLHKPLISFEENIYNLGSLILIAYDLPYSTRVRKAISRLLRRSPCFKLAPSIYLFPHARYEVYEGTSIVSPSGLIKRIILYGGRVTCASRLILLSDYSAKHIVEKNLNSLGERVENVYDYCLTLESGEKLIDPKLLSELKIEVATLKTLLKFYESEVSLSLKEMYSKVYKASKILSNF
ncbi:MAG: hypothetical protein QXL27_06405 [Candidatus Bathyarchaeia archaeon]